MDDAESLERFMDGDEPKAVCQNCCDGIDDENGLYCQSCKEKQMREAVDAYNRHFYAAYNNLMGHFPAPPPTGLEFMGMIPKDTE